MKRKETTLTDIANVLGISAMTVSRAINGKAGICPDLMKRVLDTADEMKYVPSHSIKELVHAGNSMTVGVVVPHFANIFFPSILESIEKYLSAKGYRILFCCSFNDPINEFRKISSLLERKIDGIIWSPVVMENNESNINMIRRQKCPFVFLDRLVEPIVTDAVIVDDYNAMTMMVKHLIAQGFRKFMYMDANRVSYVSRERLCGFREALANAGIPLRSDWVYAVGSDIADGNYGAQKLLNSAEKPDVIVCYNDPLAMGVEQILLEHKIKIPNEIGITGFSGMKGTDLLPVPITTIQQNTAELGTEAARILLCRMRNPSMRFKSMKHIVPTKLLIRASTLKS
ncbi:MAG: LacI family DNA-binding transcriptional regulator [Lentisphaeria bacterium]